MIRDALIEYCIKSEFHIIKNFSIQFDENYTNRVLSDYRIYLEKLPEDELMDEVEKARKKLKEV